MTNAINVCNSVGVLGTYT